MTSETWLREHAIVGGEVLSWVNPKHPGYAYAEAAGLLVRWFSLSGLALPAAVVETLCSLVDGNAVGRAERVYAFDTAVVLTGLEALDDAEDPRWTAARLRLMQAPVVRPPAPPRWSTVAGPHMLKMAVGCANRAGRGWSTPMLEALGRIEVRQDSSGRIETPPHSATYLHAHAYATEGLLAMQALGLHVPASAPGAIAFLRTCQRDDGGLPAWSDGGPSRADTTAQAIRLFILDDPTGHASAIARGLAFLDTLTENDGAVRYGPDTDDRNTWCTLFACQARAWASGATARVEDLL